MIRWLLFIALFLFPSAAVQAAEIYASNELGMELETILPSQAGKHEWVLSVSTQGGTVVKSLSKNGKEVTRWEETYRQGRLATESTYEQGVLTQTTEYRNGHPVQQTDYTDGKQSLLRSYDYSGNVLAKVTVRDGKGELLYTDSYSVGPDGRLRKAVREEAGQGHSVTLLTYENNRVAAEWLGNGSAGVLYRYSAGTLVSKETWNGLKLETEERISADSSGTTSVTTEVASGKTTTRVYDQDGLIQSERTTQKGTVIRSVAYGYRDGRLETEVTKTPGERQEIRYEYDAHGKLLTTRTTVNRQLVKVTHYTGKDSYVEDLYLNGAVVLQVFYEKGKKVREVAVTGDGTVSAGEGAAK